MKKEISTERSESKNQYNHPGLCINIFSKFFSNVFNSLMIVFQFKFSREFREVGGDKFKELDILKQKNI
jgi:hypothetical protein